MALLGRSRFEAPSLIHVEVGNAIWSKGRRGELGTDPEPGTLLERPASIIKAIDETPRVGPALAIARRIDRPICDRVYPAVAIAPDSRPVTADRRFVAAPGGARHADRIERCRS